MKLRRRDIYPNTCSRSKKSNILFFAAWPMLAACFALYYLRDLDTRWTFPAASKS